MTRIFFSADYHFDHANIILYTNRPFYKEGDVVNVADVFPNQHTDDLIFKDYATKLRCCDWMNKTIVKNHNAKVGKDDIVYHVGDFCFKRDGTYRRFMSQLNGDIVHIKGNHDHNNGCKTAITSAIMEFGNKKVLVQHVPPMDGQMETFEARLMSSVNFIICGHVHAAWKHKTIEYWAYGCRETIPCINVGIDVWDYRPVSIDSILKLYDKIKGD